MDIQNKTILITGASDGIGKETALGLAEKNPKMIIMACRESEKARQAHQLVCEHHTRKQSNVVLEFVDLADLSSIKDFVGRLSHQSIVVDVLINNAGVILNDKQQTKDGFEMQFGTNYLGHFLLTELLLQKSMISLDELQPARVINLSSHAMLFGHIDFDDIHFERRKYTGWKAYTQSKLANVMYANYLDRSYKGLIANSVHPGMVRTQFAKNSGMFHILDIALYPIFYLLSNSPAQGAQTSIYLASSPDIQSGGMYYMNSKTFTMLKNRESQDEKIQEKLYIYSKNAVGEYLTQ
ncbi:retinol dehydrogenase 13-like [Mucor ambiguus]|uniref:Retinol dehydrogenase 13-like n=1 Tax=Mucor ambiguus TaxID=91626 RepID=A0A0C9M3Y3_9FUNG|nr:retinol dehydrogenase 13-like [Mucor ambiguus]